jgi:hypothetical protein
MIWWTDPWESAVFEPEEICIGGRTDGMVGGPDWPWIMSSTAYFLDSLRGNIAAIQADMTSEYHQRDQEQHHHLMPA